MWTISRDEGVELDRLYKYNLLTPGQEPCRSAHLSAQGKGTALCYWTK